ncbi:hypothetical protein [Halorientalis halophila]|uniref:hypothetical protein n=1 Tax=Halorientalis halophila TaxID=3108499 RepID=UPI00300B950C
MVERTCPDCGVPMEPVQFSLRAGFAEFLTAYVTTDEDGGGLLGLLGGGRRRPVSTVRCPECGLLRQYA